MILLALLGFSSSPPMFGVAAKLCFHATTVDKSMLQCDRSSGAAQQELNSLRIAKWQRYGSNSAKLSVKGHRAQFHSFHSKTKTDPHSGKQKL